MPRKKTDQKPQDSQNAAHTDTTAPIIDVSKPGSTPAGPTSRPVIRGHQSGLRQDPLLKDNSGENQPSGAPLPNAKIMSKAKKITPLTPDTETADPKSADDKNQTPNDAGTTTDKTASSETEPAPQQAAPEENNKTLDNANDEAETGTGAIDSLAGEVEAKAKSKEKSKEEKEKAEQVQALAGSGKYHLPITKGGKKGASERFVTAILVLLLVASIGAYIAIDIGALDIGVNLPYEFIK